jgi:hypothetical protein
MPWYSYIGFGIVAIGAALFIHDFYQNYKKTTLPFNKAVDIAKAH